MTASISPSARSLFALMKLKGVGRRAALRIVGSPLQTESDDFAHDVLIERAERAKLSPSDVNRAWVIAEEELSRSVEAGIAVLSIFDDRYPARLRNIQDPPAILYAKGDATQLHNTYCLAVVGTRDPTTYGEKVARKSAATAAELGFAIVSGLAHGCDTLGHEGCLDAKGIGIAVLAHGLDKVYPAANRGLADRLLAGGGCFVSEYPLGMAAQRTSFAERDRIQSGLSDGVLVIETDVKGGTMHTVRFARDQRRALACIDHPATLKHESKTKGNQQLIADRWATPVPDGQALVAFLDRLKSVVDNRPAARDLATHVQMPLAL